MLSETLAHLTRRIAKESDHLSERGETADGVQGKVPDAALRPASPLADDGNSADDGRQDRNTSQDLDPLSSTTPDSAENTASDSGPPSRARQEANKRKNAVETPAAVGQRRPAKRTGSSTASTSAASSQEEAADDAASEGGDWQRLHIN